MSKQIVEVFNNHLIEFIDDLLLLYPDDNDVWKGKLYVNGTRLITPSIHIKTWYEYTKPYKEQIEKGDVSYFLNIDYNENVKNDRETSSLLDKVKGVVRELEKENLKKAIQYIKNLTQLAFHYKGLTK